MTALPPFSSIDRGNASAQQLTSGPTRALKSTLRLRLDLAYDGTDFSGWAAQPGRRTVEGVLSDALTTLLRAPEPVRLTVAGRTDAGVHARGQVAHADVEEAARLIARFLKNLKGNESFIP